MHQVHLAGVAHGSNMFGLPNHTYMLPQSIELFSRHVVPHISNSTVIIAESEFSDEPVGPGHPEYDRLLKKYCPMLIGQCTPTFTLVDPTGKLSGDEFNITLTRFERISRFFYNVIVIERYPASFDEMLEWCRNSNHSYRFKKQPTAKVRRWIKSVVPFSMSRDVAFAAHADMASVRGGNVVVLVGAAHAINIKIAVPHWQLHLLYRGAENVDSHVRSIYRSIICHDVVPRSFLD